MIQDKNDLSGYQFAKRAIVGTLAWCNEVRRLNGKEPVPELPKGARQDSKTCPCGTLTGLAVGLNSSLQVKDTTYGREEGMRTPVPFDVSTFVELFDAGHLPQFDKHDLRSLGVPVGEPAVVSSLASMI